MKNLLYFTVLLFMFAECDNSKDYPLDTELTKVQTTNVIPDSCTNKSTKTRAYDYLPDLKFEFQINNDHGEFIWNINSSKIFTAYDYLDLTIESHSNCTLNFYHKVLTVYMNEIYLPRSPSHLGSAGWFEWGSPTNIALYAGQGSANIDLRIPLRKENWGDGGVTSNFTEFKIKMKWEGYLSPSSSSPKIVARVWNLKY